METFQFPEIPAGHVRLFRREFLDHLASRDFVALSRFISHQQNDKITELVRNYELDTAKHFLFGCLAYSEKCDAIKAIRLIISRCKDEDVRKQLQLYGLQTHFYYAKLFTGDGEPLKMDRLAGVLEPGPIVDYLQTVNTREYEPLLRRVERLIKANMISEAVCELLRGLPYCSDHFGSTRHLGDWYYDFLKAALSSGYTKMLPRYIDQDYEEDMANRKAKLELERKKRLEALPSFTELVADNDAKEDRLYMPREPRDQKCYAQYRNTSAAWVAGLERRYYQLYPYQSELVSAARAGKNTIICAPTGSGKTIVATDIVLHHVQERRRDDKISRAVMLVPTVPLIEQQALHFIRYTYGICWVDGISGAETVENRAGNVLASDLIVMTPQILINMLNSALKSKRVYFSDFTMLIFDECHHVMSGAHPYKVLMEMLDAAKLPSPPQIIGLTASIGTGSSLWDVRSSRQHILNMCFYMRADTISTVRKNLDNLRSHVVPPADEVERVSRPLNDKFAYQIREAMHRIQESMASHLLRIVNGKLAPLKLDDIEFPPHEQTIRYQNTVAALRRGITKLDDMTLRLRLLRCIDHLSHYFHALGVSDLLPNKYGLSYLDGKMSTYSSPTSVDREMLGIYAETRRNLVDLSANESLEDKTILKRLYNILADQYKQKPASRTLIFVSTRTCAQHISQHLSEYLASRRDMPAFYGQKNCVGYMTSSNQSASVGGQSAEFQRMMRDQFERGHLKILAVTSVADEGINIMECNLVIKYNNVGSERTMIQRRGRARAKDSRSILLALDNGIEIHEYENVRREMMMYKCIEDLQSLSEDGLKTAFKLDRKVAETARDINDAFGLGTTNERMAQSWFNKFHNGYGSFEAEERP